jgi:hypothetical protein
MKVFLFIFISIDKILIFCFFYNIVLLHFLLLLLNFMQPYLSAPIAPRANALPTWMLNGNPSSPSGPLVALTASALPGPSNQGIYLDQFLSHNSLMETHSRCKIFLFLH